MARDVCIDCEGDFPYGEGLKDGLCPGCREARRLQKAADEGPPPEASEPEPEAEAEAELEAEPEPEPAAEERQEE